jgi:hypothetical protein
LAKKILASAFLRSFRLVDALALLARISRKERPAISKDLAAKCPDNDRSTKARCFATILCHKKRYTQTPWPAKNVLSPSAKSLTSLVLSRTMLLFLVLNTGEYNLIKKTMAAQSEI